MFIKPDVPFRQQWLPTTVIVGAVSLLVPIYLTVYGQRHDAVATTLNEMAQTFFTLGEGYRLNMWDVGGQKTIRAYWRNYFEATDGIIWVVDSADPIRLRDCAKELWDLLDAERLAGATLLVMANKQDIPTALSMDSIKETLSLDDISSRHWAIFPVSAITGKGLEEAVDWLVDDISGRVFMG
ncbi:small GTPase superfamily, ARF type [Kipferlia bialata]|uniref:Small GTPase superfamily, ARF type n=1 Tax=Kipferlia bialata TaxID=797122 RepID=A0A9K3GFP4_9EUKA|nr:small GTPase superfamily, ARF type [Kipferlia bialata]|eukprot:g2113.t1